MVFNYDANDLLINRMIQDGKTERDIVDFFNLFPPTRFILSQPLLTVSALKAILTIDWESRNLEECSISIDQTSFLNVGIAYSLS